MTISKVYLFESEGAIIAVDNFGSVLVDVSFASEEERPATVWAVRQTVSRHLPGIPQVWVDSPSVHPELSVLLADDGDEDGLAAVPDSGTHACETCVHKDVCPGNMYATMIEFSVSGCQQYKEESE